MLRGRWKWLGRVWLGAVMLTWLACGGVDGERASTPSGDRDGVFGSDPGGGCPPGETCDPATPRGLTFESEPLGDSNIFQSLREPNRIRPTVVGGEQTIRFGVRTGLFGSELPPENTASSDDEAVFEVVASERASAHIRGVAAGTARLRIEGASGDLLDRVRVDTAEVATTTLRAPTANVDHEGEWAFFAGGTSLVVFALFDESGNRLIDASANPTETDDVTRIDWDLATVALPAAGTEVTLALTAGGQPLTASGPLVSSVDRIERFVLDRSELLHTPRVRSDRRDRFCFLAYSGDRAVAGTQPTLTAEGPITATLDDPAQAGEICVVVQGTEPGSARLDLELPGASASLSVTVVE